MKALIVGGARSGKYIALLLNREGYDVVLTDIASVEYKDELLSHNIKVVDKGHPDSLLNVHYDLIVKNPGIKYTSPFITKLMDKGYRIYNEIDIALRYVDDVNVIAVSGTNGKTTTVTLIYEMMKRMNPHTFLCGNIGVPVSEIVYKHETIDHLVLELSSFQLDGIYDLKPNYAALTNLQSDHLDYYDSLDDYFKSKQKIYRNQDSNDYLIVNSDDEMIKKYLDNPQSTLITYALNKHADVMLKDTKVVYKDNELFDVDHLSLKGKHNVYNASLASIIAFLNSVNIKYIQEVLYNFKGVEHRIEYVDTLSGVAYYNDSKATNVESVSVAIDAFNESIILIAGGYDKHISFEGLQKYNEKVECAILFGETKEKLSQVFTTNVMVDTLEEAIHEANRLNAMSKVVLFSPACASFDQFKDYEHRGREFKRMVQNLKNNG